MKSLVDIGQRLKKMIIPMICTLIIVYFLMYGMRSMQDRAYLLEEITTLEQKYDTVHRQRLAIESHVNLLKPGQINPDFLDEKSRETLGLMHEDEIVIFQK